MTDNEKECSANGDCADNQWCSKVLNTTKCANYTECSLWNRKNSSQPARYARECGQCFEGYSENSKLLGNREREMCSKTENYDKRDNNSEWISSGILFAIFIVLVIIYCIGWVKERIKNDRQRRNTATESARPSVATHFIATRPLCGNRSDPNDDPNDDQGLLSLHDDENAKPRDFELVPLTNDIEAARPIAAVNWKKKGQTSSHGAVHSRFKN